MHVSPLCPHVNIQMLGILCIQSVCLPVSFSTCLLSIMINAGFMEDSPIISLLCLYLHSPSMQLAIILECHQVLHNNLIKTKGKRLLSLKPLHFQSLYGSHHHPPSSVIGWIFVWVVCIVLQWKTAFLGLAEVA